MNHDNLCALSLHCSQQLGVTSHQQGSCSYEEQRCALAVPLVFSLGNIGNSSWLITSGFFTRHSAEGPVPSLMEQKWFAEPTAAQPRGNADAGQG